MTATSPATQPLRAVDIDNHYYEIEDCFSRHIEPRFREHAVHLVEVTSGGKSHQRWAVDDEFVSLVLTDPAGAVPPPGALAGYFSGEETLKIREVIDARSHPPFMRRDARLELLDEQGLDAALLLPTVGMLIENDLSGRPDVLCANFRGFNRWLEEDWGYGADGRILAAPMLTLADIDWAVEELERVAALGARAVVLKTGPVQGRSPADTCFDPFWARVNEMGIKIAFHVGDGCFRELYAQHWGEDPTRAIFRYSALQHYLCQLDRPISDTLAALILHNLFGRYPNLEVMTIELGSVWVAPFLKSIDKAARSGQEGTWPFGRLDRKPSEIFREHVYVTPFHEEDVIGLVELLGADRVLFGSDYPHPEGLADPTQFRTSLAGLSDHDAHLVMAGNGARLLGLDPERPAR